VSELTSHARRLVVAEITAQHPLTTLNPFWLKFHGLRRPVSPTAADLLEILTAMGLRPRAERWTRPGGPDYASFDELVDVTSGGSASRRSAPAMSAPRLKRRESTARTRLTSAHQAVRWSRSGGKAILQKSDNAEDGRTSVLDVVRMMTAKARMGQQA